MVRGVRIIRTWPFLSWVVGLTWFCWLVHCCGTLLPDPRGLSVPRLSPLQSLSCPHGQTSHAKAIRVEGGQASPWNTQGHTSPSDTQLRRLSVGCLLLPVSPPSPASLMNMSLTYPHPGSLCIRERNEPTPDRTHLFLPKTVSACSMWKLTGYTVGSGVVFCRHRDILRGGRCWGLGEDPELHLHRLSLLAFL